MPIDDGGEGAASREADADLAPVIPLFGSSRASGSVGDSAGGWDRTWASPPPWGSAESPRADIDADGDADRAEEAEKALLRRLRTRQLSSAEARTVLREHDLDDDAIALIIEGFEQRGYLDDARLAEQLAYAGVERKGQGRRAIATALTARGIPRATADAALAELPDDDDERALAYARSKVQRGRVTDREAALRRLVGQLTRRGYPSSVSLTAARTALDEQR